MNHYGDAPVDFVPSLSLDDEETPTCFVYGALTHRVWLLVMRHLAYTTPKLEHQHRNEVELRDAFLGVRKMLNATRQMIVDDTVRWDTLIHAKTFKGVLMERGVTV